LSIRGQRGDKLGKVILPGSSKANPFDNTFDTLFLEVSFRRWIGILGAFWRILGNGFWQFDDKAVEFGRVRGAVIRAELG